MSCGFEHRLMAAVCVGGAAAADWKEDSHWAKHPLLAAVTAALMSQRPALKRARRIVAYTGMEPVCYLLPVRLYGRHPLYMPSDILREISLRDGGSPWLDEQTMRLTRQKAEIHE
jgi:hypothetical protein